MQISTTLLVLLSAEERFTNSAIRSPRSASSSSRPTAARRWPNEYVGERQHIDRRFYRRPPPSSVASNYGGSPLTQFYGRPVRHCASNADCDVIDGELCQRIYDGCRRGRCMCDPRSLQAQRSPPTTQDQLAEAAELGRSVGSLSRTNAAGAMTSPLVNAFHCNSAHGKETCPGLQQCR